MASHVIALLAASGLLASGAVQTANPRSADALPTAKTALVKVSAQRAAGCFSTLNGKTLKVAKGISKAKCATPVSSTANFAEGSGGGGGGVFGGGFVSAVAGGVAAGAVGGAIGGAIAKNDNASGG